MNFGSFVSFDLEYASPPLQNILRTAILNQDWYTSNTLMPLPFSSLFTMAVFSCLLG